MRKKDAPLELTPPPAKRALEPIYWHGEPERICGNCQHLKGGHCRNLISGNWKAEPKDAACKRGWYPDVKRFPIHELMGIGIGHVELPPSAD